MSSSSAIAQLVNSIKHFRVDTIAAIIISGLVLRVAYQVIYNVFFHPLREYPGPFLWRISRIPVDYSIFHGKQYDNLRRFHEQYGEVVRVAPDELSFSSPQACDDVLSHHHGKEEFPKDVRRQQLPPNGIRNILGADKDNHSRYRRLLAHAFSEKGLREQMPRIQNYVDLLVNRLSEKAGTGENVDIVNWYTMTVFDVIGDLAWGASFDSLRDRNIHEWIPAILANVQYVLQSAIFKRRGLGMFDSYLVDPEILRLRKKNFALAEERVDQRLAYKGEKRGDFWDRVVIKSADDNATGEGMSKGEMLVNAAVIILGGAETSATTLSGATYLLLQHPDKLQRAVKEIRSAFKSSDEIDVFSVSRLTYMNAILDEAMRVYPPVPIQSQRVTPRGGGMVCGKWLPENTVINLPQIAACHDPKNFYRHDEFIPERWLDDAPAEFANDDRSALMPFSLGTRNCIGKNLAYAEMRLIFAKVLYHFDLQLDAAKTGDWFNQKAYGVWQKNPEYVKVSLARK